MTSLFRRPAGDCRAVSVGQVCMYVRREEGRQRDTDWEGQQGGGGESEGPWLGVPHLLWGARGRGRGTNCHIFYPSRHVGEIPGKGGQSPLSTSQATVSSIRVRAFEPAQCSIGNSPRGLITIPPERPFLSIRLPPFSILQPPTHNQRLNIRSPCLSLATADTTASKLLLSPSA